MTTTETVRAETVAHLRLLHDQAQRELAKADAKAATLTAFALAVLFGLSRPLLDDPGSLPAVERVLLWLAALPTLAAILALLSALLPSLRHAGVVPGTWLHATTATPNALLNACHGDPYKLLAEDVCALARLASGKYQRIRRAVVLLAIGVTSAVAGPYLAQFATVVSG